MSGFDASTAAGPARLQVDLAARPVELLVRQRTRLAARLAGLGEPGWRRATRCPLWDIADVVIHLGDAADWAGQALAAAGTGGAVPAFLQGFDPNRTPHEHVLAGRGAAPEALLARLREGTGVLADSLRAADLPEVPSVPWVGGQSTFSPGLVTLHILWDSWLHELDLDEALAAEGVTPEAEACRMELDAVAAYAIFFAGLMFARALGPGDRVALHVELDDLAYDLRVGNGVVLSRAAAPAPDALGVRGPAVATVEALAGRGDLAQVAEGDPRAIAMLSGLGARMRGPSGVASGHR